MSSVHKDHRKRVRRKFLESTLDCFSDHEVLEFLLFFSIPYKNTNELAHILINKFGSLSGVLDAGYDELLKVNGVGETTATFLSLIPQAGRRYIIDKESNTKVFDKMSLIGDYLVNHFIGATKEKVEILIFDAGMRMIDHTTIHEGAVNSSDINPEKIAEYVFTKRASCFVLAHNHPGGSVEPSDEDITVTKMLRSAFEPFNIIMLEHYVVSGGEYRGIMRWHMK